MAPSAIHARFKLLGDDMLPALHDALLLEAQKDPLNRSQWFGTLCEFAFSDDKLEDKWMARVDKRDHKFCIALKGCAEAHPEMDVFRHPDTTAYIEVGLAENRKRIDAVHAELDAIQAEVAGLKSARPGPIRRTRAEITAAACTHIAKMARPTRKYTKRQDMYTRNNVI
jgi:hypothetical protein